MVILQHASNESQNEANIDNDSDDNDVKQSLEQKNENVDGGSNARNEGGNRVNIS